MFRTTYKLENYRISQPCPIIFHATLPCSAIYGMWVGGEGNSYKCFFNIQTMVIFRDLQQDTSEVFFDNSETD